MFFAHIVKRRKMTPGPIRKYEHRTSVIQNIQPKRRLRRERCLIELAIPLSEEQIDGLRVD